MDSTPKVEGFPLLTWTQDPSRPEEARGTGRSSSGALYIYRVYRTDKGWACDYQAENGVWDPVCRQADTMDAARALADQHWGGPPVPPPPPKDDPSVPELLANILRLQERQKSATARLEEADREADDLAVEIEDAMEALAIKRKEDSHKEVQFLYGRDLVTLVGLGGLTVTPLEQMKESW